MMKPDPMEEWLEEVEARPSSAPLMIRFISNRLKDLTERNEELLKENIALRSEKKVEEYEARIAKLEYQLEMLRRQLGSGDLALQSTAASSQLNLIAYTRHGQVVRIEVERDALATGQLLARIAIDDPEPGLAPRLLATSSLEELLFVFDSGRTVTLPVSDLPAIPAGEPDWSQARLVEPRGGEELVAVTPIGRLALYDFSVQASRRGCARKIMRSSLDSHIQRGFVGAGIKQKPDRMMALQLCMKDDHLILASREGFLARVAVSDLAFTAEELMRLSSTDHITSSFPIARKSTLVAVTQNGKVLSRALDWLEASTSGKSRGQPIFSPARREAGVRLAGAAAVDDQDWGLALCRDGRIFAYALADILPAGALPGDAQEEDILEFQAFSLPAQEQAHGT